jgi:uncharacterized protein with FMN-binding domain
MKLKWVTGAFMAFFSVFVLIAVVGGAWVKPKTANTTTTGSSAGSTTQKPDYKDGVFTGQVANNVYGPVQIQAIISGGKIIQIAFVQMPSSSSVSLSIEANAEPILQRETLQAQSAHITIVSRATYDSNSYIESLQSALNQAQKS